MNILFTLSIIFFIAGFIIKTLKSNNSSKKTINYEKYRVKNLMTQTEKTFLDILKICTNKYNLIILPQIQLQSIFKTINKNDISSFNKIKSKSIDFAIVDNNYQYKFFIELDDYTHNRIARIKRDEFINQLFEKHNLKLVRIKVKSNYELQYIENIIKEVV